MRRLALLALLGWAAVGGVAQSQEPFLPGQVKSQALAESVWHPDCVHVGVAPFTGGATGGRLGEAYVGHCSLAVDWAGIRDTNAGMMAHASTIRRVDETSPRPLHGIRHSAISRPAVGQPTDRSEHCHPPERARGHLLRPRPTPTSPARAISKEGATRSRRLDRAG
jgi:hypothetical protein